MPGSLLFQTRLVNCGRMSHVNAVRSLSDGSSFQYEANGNMTRRVEISGTQRNSSPISNSGISIIISW